MSYDVEYYELPDGSKPAEEFILAQDKKMQAKIFMASNSWRNVDRHCESHFQSPWEMVSSR